MAYYVFQAPYTAEVIANRVKAPQNRAEAVRVAVEKMGGRVEGFWFAFGEYDTVEILQLPDNVSAAAFSMAVSAGGAFKAIKTTPLITLEESVAAMRKAPETGYQPPSSK
jgi:uncharacterized protein with GYD domain